MGIFPQIGVNIDSGKKQAASLGLGKFYDKKLTQAPLILSIPIIRVSFI